MAAFFAILDYIVTAEGVWAFIWKYTGLRKIALFLLNRRRVVNAGGLAFYPDRDALDRARTWGELIGSCQEIDGLFLIGDNITSQEVGLHKVKRMLLPNPNSHSVDFYRKTGGRNNIPELIRESTKAALVKGVRVKWANEFPGYSFVILDKNSDNARVHVEYVLPYMPPPERPSLTIWKRRFPGAFTAFLNAYDSLWDESPNPPGSA